jgi:hypothetical protein
MVFGMPLRERDNMATFIVCTLNFPVVIAGAPGKKPGDQVTLNAGDYQTLSNRGAVTALPGQVPDPEITSIPFPWFWRELGGHGPYG